MANGLKSSTPLENTPPPAPLDLTPETAVEKKAPFEEKSNQTDKKPAAAKLTINPEAKVVEGAAKSRVPTPARTTVGRWSAEEHELFLEGLRKHGKSWKKIAQMIRTRTLVQIRTHAQKYLQKQQWQERQNTPQVSVGMKRPSPIAMHQPMFFPMMDPMMLPTATPLSWDPIPELPSVDSSLAGIHLDDNYLQSPVKVDAVYSDSPTSVADSALDFSNELSLGDDLVPEDLDFLAECISTDLETLSMPEISDVNLQLPTTPKPITMMPDQGMKKRRLQPYSAHSFNPGMVSMSRSAPGDPNQYMWMHQNMAPTHSYVASLHGV